MDRSPIRTGMGVAVVMVEKRPSGAEKEPGRGDLSPDRGGRSRAAASNYIRATGMRHSYHPK